ncbi:MAG: tetratricopeptide repeat protein [Planctomycetaceae bacterium]|nr:tetratricopeptide repeat protein [Planctomycetaceae bacterium]
MASIRWLLAVCLLVFAVPAAAQALPPKAQECFDAAFRLNLQGKIGGAIAKYEEALAIAPKSKEVLLEYVVVLRKACRFQQSARAGWRLLEIDGSNPAAWTNLGNTFLAAEDWEGAAFAFDKATMFSKDKAFSVQNLLNLGYAQCDAGDPEGALKVFAKALKLDSKSGTTHIDIAIAHSRLGHKQEALDSVKAGLALLAKQTDSRAQSAKHFGELVLKRLEANEPIRSGRPIYRQSLPESFGKQPAKGKAAALEIEKQSAHAVDLGKDRLASLSAPEIWTLQVEPAPSGSTGPDIATLTFIPPPGERFLLVISLIDTDKSLERIKEEVELAGLMIQLQAGKKAEKVELHELTTPNLQGFYFSDEDEKLRGKEPAEGDFPFVTQGVARVGGVSCTFTLLTFDLEEATMAPLFAVLKDLAVETGTK